MPHLCMYEQSRKALQPVIYKGLVVEIVFFLKGIELVKSLL